ncbi:G-protein coupled receptor dmsr-1-like [Tribolium madens]|uniref:G-protein coupled receptor dmsr-1-like n=1 Tax=Tribolium madens TaxID=41895 RepID=UPI001CF757F4|nr:G-protein coupled receptor dmsr-1-like [Tribolium madens]
MDQIAQTNSKIEFLVASINILLCNETLNLTESQKESFRKARFLVKCNESDTFDRHYSGDCGGRHLAEYYAHEIHPFLAIVVCFIGILTNLTNIIVLTRKEMSCTPINRILAALSVTEIFQMVEYIPYVCYHYLVLLKKHDFPFYGAIYMVFHIHLTQILHTTTVCLTLLLAIWRYLMLRYPDKKRILCSQFRCTLGITACCVLPFVLCIPNFIITTITEQEIVENGIEYILYHTDLSETFKSDKTLLRIIFLIYAVFLKLLPCCILTAINCWLVNTLFKAKEGKLALRNYDCFELKENDANQKILKSEKRTHRTTKMLIVVLFLFLITEIPQGIFALLIGFKGKEVFLECYQSYGALMDMLALVDGAVSFFLYCRMSTMFCITFSQLFKRTKLSLLARIC